jgi:hypothetical protein
VLKFLCSNENIKNKRKLYYYKNIKDKKNCVIIKTPPIISIIIAPPLIRLQASRKKIMIAKQIINSHASHRKNQQIDSSETREK